MNTRARTVMLLSFGAALWGGCTANTDDAGAPPVVAAPSDEEPEASSEEESTDDAAPATRDAGKPKKDAGKPPTPSDAGTEDPDSGSCWPFPCATDAGVVDAAVKDSAPPACNNVPVAVVTPKAVGGFQPLNGGTIVDGTYTLKASTRYISGTSNTTFPAMGEGVTIAGSSLELRITAPSFGLSSSYNYTFTASGNKLTLTRTCPSTGTETWYYDAQGSTLILYNLPQSNGTWYQTFEKL